MTDSLSNPDKRVKRSLSYIPDMAQTETTRLLNGDIKMLASVLGISLAVY